MCDEKSELNGMSYAGAMLYSQYRDEIERRKPKNTEPPEPVPSKEEVLEYVDLIVLTLKDALNERTPHRRELMLEDVAMRLKTLQKGLHDLLEVKDGSEIKE